MKSPFLQKWGKPLLLLLAVGFIVPTLLHSRKDLAIVSHANPGWLAAGMALFFLSYLVQAFGWCFILRAMGQPATVAISLRMFYMSMIARWAPGRIWYSATRLYLAKQAGISVTAVTFGIVLELIYILVGGILASLIFAGSLVKGLLTLPGGQQMLTGVCVAAFVCGALVLRPGFLLWMSRFPFFRKAVRKLAGEELTDANMPTLSTARSLGLLAYFTGYWIFSGVMFAVLAHAFLPHMSFSQSLACIPTFATSWLAGFFAIVTPAGLGVREAAMIGLLRLANMTTGEAAILTIASRLAMLATELLSAGLFSLLLRNAGALPTMPTSGDDKSGGAGTEPIVSGGGPDEIITNSGIWHRHSSEPVA